MSGWDFEHDGPLLMVGDVKVSTDLPLGSPHEALSSTALIPWGPTGPARLRARGRILASVAIHGGDQFSVLDFDGLPLAEASFGWMRSSGGAYLSEPLPAIVSARC